MELRQLEYFVAIAEESNFTRAAERVRISQSGVSAQMRQLERELGTPLIDRTTRIATLTPAGVAALSHARDALASAKALVTAVNDVQGLVRGELRVGMVTGCTITPLFAALEAFHRAHPGVILNIQEGNSIELVEQIRISQLDVALIGTVATDDTDVILRPVLSEPLVACVPRNHQLASLASVTMAEIVAYPLVCMPHGTGVRTLLDMGFAERRLDAQVSIEASAASTVANLASRGLGVAILSQTMAKPFTKEVTTLPIRDLTHDTHLALAWRGAHSTATRAFLSHCEEAFTDWTDSE